MTTFTSHRCSWTQFIVLCLHFSWHYGPGRGTRQPVSNRELSLDTGRSVNPSNAKPSQKRKPQFSDINHSTQNL
ncbi:hypothetical protein DL98DRAFT_4921 [Cadophora sp. DSE1049]|nr:hypothetical protein DL98DRAFT_4921 [Cadophora sp. DSE1049]